MSETTGYFVPRDIVEVSPEERRPYNYREHNWKASNGMMLTQALFDEYNQDRSKFFPIFTTGRDDIVLEGKYLWSFRRLYLEVGDPTDYLASTFLVGDPKHWNKLLASPVTKGFIEDCRQELEAKIKAEALASLRILASSGDSKGLAAAKYMAALEYRDTGSKRGRPSKEEKEGKLKQETRAHSDVMADAARIGLKVVGG